MPGSNLSNANLARAELHGASLPGSFLCGSDLRRADLSNAQLQNADLTRARLYRAGLTDANLEGADLRGADLAHASLGGCKLKDAKLQDAILDSADLGGADLTGADLTGVTLVGASLVKTNLTRGTLTNCRVFGASVWCVNLTDAIQSNLIVTPREEPTIEVDNLEVAQFVYLLLNNERIRSIIDTIGHKAVLILGRFIPERKSVLDALRDSLRAVGFVPMMFDFERPTQRDFTETIKTLAGLSRFIIADITNPRSSPLELQATMPDYMIPFVPIIAGGEEPFAMFRDLKQKYGEWVLDLLVYDSTQTLVQVLQPAIIQPALQKGRELVSKKAEGIRIRHAADYLRT